MIVSAGFAGALADGWQVGDVLAAEEVVEGNGRCWPVRTAGAILSGHRRGRLLTMPRLIGDPDEKRQLGRQHQAVAVDMESAALASECAEQGLPFTTVRAISDDVQARLSPQLVHLLGGPRVSAPQLIRTVVGSPRVVPELWRLARGTRKAAHHLASALEAIILQQACSRG